MSTVIVITPPPKQQDRAQLEQDLKNLREAGFEVQEIEPKKD